MHHRRNPGPPQRELASPTRRELGGARAERVGKTTLIRVASMWIHPSAGRVTVLGETLGRTDVRCVRSRIGFAGAALADMLRPELRVADVVMPGANAALEPWWHHYDEADESRAGAALDRVGCAHLGDRPFGACSSG
ncbi:MAG: ATP-binding cassette domain-containing protein, partial [Acidimicrobiales bacterium]